MVGVVCDSQGREATAEVATARLIDPGLTLAVNFAIFLAVLLVRPTGLFGRPSS